MDKRLILGGTALLVLAVGGYIGWYVLEDASPSAAGTNLPTSSPTSTPQYVSVAEVKVVTTDALFASEDTSLPDRLDPSKLIVVVSTGDVIPARGVDAQIRKNGVGYPFDGAGIRSLLQQSDLTIANLEAPLLTNCPIHNSGFTFCGQAAFAQSMADSGIDLVTMANNHIGNFGHAGILETIKHVSEAHIEYADNSHLSIQTVKGLTIGTLAFSGVGGKFYPETIKQQIEKARPQVDLLFVAYHWGKEYVAEPIPDPNIAPDDPVTMGRFTIDAGADMVIGNHPHWVQGAEVYKDKFISYALGNFIFDQSWSTETMQGAVGRYTFYGNKLIKAEFIPVHIYNQAQPRLAEGTEKVDILNQMQQSTIWIKSLQ